VEWLLLRPGVQVDARNHGGGSPLHSAAAHGRASVLDQLLQAGSID
jgi:ankyrin repeat protein